MKLDENMMNSTKNWWRHQKITLSICSANNHLYHCQGLLPKLQWFRGKSHGGREPLKPQFYWGYCIYNLRLFLIRDVLRSYLSNIYDGAFLRKFLTKFLMMKIDSLKICPWTYIDTFIKWQQWDLTLQPLNHLAKLVITEPRYSHLNFRYGACFEQRVPWHSVALVTVNSLWNLFVTW